MMKSEWSRSCLMDPIFEWFVWNASLSTTTNNSIFWDSTINTEYFTTLTWPIVIIFSQRTMVFYILSVFPNREIWIIFFDSIIVKARFSKINISNTVVRERKEGFLFIKYRMNLGLVGISTGTSWGRRKLFLYLSFFSIGLHKDIVVFRFHTVILTIEIFPRIRS